MPLSSVQVLALNNYLPSSPVHEAPRLNTSFSFYWNSSTLSYVIHINWTLPLIYDIPKVVQTFQLTGSTMLFGRLIPSFRNFALRIPAVSVYTLLLKTDYMCTASKASHCNLHCIDNIIVWIPQQHTQLHTDTVGVCAHWQLNACYFYIV